MVKRNGARKGSQDRAKYFCHSCGGLTVKLTPRELAEERRRGHVLEAFPLRPDAEGEVRRRTLALEDHCFACSGIDRERLKQEGGVTDYSLHNAHALLKRRGLPVRIELAEIGDDGETVTATWDDAGGPFSHAFTGFSWGYVGTGPCGLEKFFGVLGLPIGMEQISAWPRGQGVEFKMTFHRGADYGAAVGVVCA